jgi:hypothetical protein
MFRFRICLLLLAGLTGCGTSPQALGLTGAPQQTPPESPGDNVLGTPGLPQGNNPYSSSTAPTTGSGQYYGY